MIERTARSLVVALIAPLLAVACASAPPPTAPVLAAPERAPSFTPMPQPIEGGPCTVAKELDWLMSTDEVRLSVFETGHGGIWNLHTVIRRQQSEFEGVVIAAHARRPDGAIQSASRVAHVDIRDVIELLQAFRDGAQAEDRPAGPQFSVEDSSRTLHIQLDAIAPGKSSGSPWRRVQFFVDEGQRDPQPWHLRGCDRPVAVHVQNTLRAALAKLAGPLGWTELETKLRAHP